jgi:hypothetical protein
MGVTKEIRRSNTSNGDDTVRQQLREQWEKNKPEKDHVEDACFFKGLHTDRQVDSSENPELMSVTIECFESVEKPRGATARNSGCGLIKRTRRNTEGDDRGI